MTYEDQIIEIKQFCDEILDAERDERFNALEKYLWKIERIAGDMRMLIESGDLEIDG